MSLSSILYGRISLKVHRLVSLNNLNFVLVLFKDLYAVGAILISIGLCEDFAVVALDWSLVLDLAALDDANINIGS